MLVVANKLQLNFFLFFLNMIGDTQSYLKKIEINLLQYLINLYKYILVNEKKNCLCGNCRRYSSRRTY